MSQISNVITRLRPPNSLTERLTQTLIQPLPANCQQFSDEFIQLIGEDNLAALLFYGSHKSGSQNQRNVSMVDFYAVIRDDAVNRVLLRLIAGGEGQANLWSLLKFAKYRLLYQFLAPLIIDKVMLNEQQRIEGGAKFCLITEKQLTTYLSDRAPDNHQLARFSQPMRLCYPRTDEGIKKSLRWLLSAQRRSFDFISEKLPNSFDVTQYLRIYLQECYRAECRPETSQRVDDLIAAEHNELTGIYGDILKERTMLHPGFDWCTESDTFSFDHDVRRTFSASLQQFNVRRSQVREIGRWGKNIATFDSWMEYILDKIERSVAHRIEPSPVSKKLWFITLPYFFVEYLIAKRRFKKRNLS